MKITKFVPDNEILKEFAKRLTILRKAQGYSQIELAQKAGIGVATLRRIESGKDSQFETWLKILKALDRVPALEALLPETFDSPMAQVLAGKSHRRKKPSSSTGIVWGDETR
ncbi:MAG: helix-turn-helix transcriptional regulator [Aestuariivita sp.]|nr:helix-turn-helix transcriptional regulator [Aestuariivita sp.]MCY4287288.1 helix-turn-helix transcriptional regulator [Aestuariivita sp.]MCY4346521.1 helix-turn-helix transcriptional regulator [Aestuariivita sp.]